LIGSKLIEVLLERGHEPVVLTRSPERLHGKSRGVEVRRWSPGESGGGCESLRGADAVVNLSGEPIDGGRWTPERKRRIRDSRVLGTRDLVTCFSQQEPRPEVLIAGSAVGFYGSRGDHVLRESDAVGSGFLAGVCSDLEREAERAEELGVRVIRLRTGLVLSAKGGALRKLVRPFRVGLGGRLGNGRQWLSWIHIDDLTQIIAHCLETRSISGAVNAVSPNPVTNREFTRVLGEVLARPAVVRVPGFALRLGIGELADALLSSQRAVSDLITQSGFAFRFDDLRQALADCLVDRQPD
jgi:uncharacterized protein (TIGR01777 family)